MNPSSDLCNKAIGTLKKTKLYRNVDTFTGRRVVSHINAMTRTLTTGTIRSVQSIVQDDFNRCLEVLDLARDAFPEPLPKETGTTPLNVDQLTELQRWPASIVNSNLDSVIQDLAVGRLPPEEAGKLILRSLNSYKLSTEERGQAVAERDQAVAELKIANRDPIPHLFAAYRRKIAASKRKRSKRLND